MPKRRPPKEVWQELRKLVWERDKHRCQYPDGKHPVPLHEAHIDHVISGKRGRTASLTSAPYVDFITCCGRTGGSAG